MIFRGRLPAQPFVDALTELVQAQADTTGFVVLHRWVEARLSHRRSTTPGNQRSVSAPGAKRVKKCAGGPTARGYALCLTAHALVAPTRPAGIQHESSTVRI